MNDKTDTALTAGERSVPEVPAKGEISLEDFAALCHDEHWMAGLIQDTENRQMLQAPAHMKDEILERQKRGSSSRENRSSSPRIIMLRYGLQVSAAAAAAIMLLFSWPAPVQNPAMGRQPCSRYQSFTPSWANAPSVLAPEGLTRKIHDFSHFLNPFSTEFINGEVTPND